jgi:hypothetical protein
MSLSSRNPSCTDRTNASKSDLSCNPSTNSVDVAGLNVVYSPDSRRLGEDEPIQDPFTYYRAFLRSDVPSGSCTATLLSHDDGVTEDTNRPGTRASEEHQRRPRGIPYSFAVRCANRSNGAPLATIIEQGSVSTLNSQGSPLSIARLPSVRAVENVLPGCVSYSISRSSDGKGLKGIEEDIHQERDIHPKTNVTIRKIEEYRSDSGPLHKVDTSTPVVSQEAGQPDTFQLPETEQELGNSGLRSFWRGVFQKGRSDSRSRSRTRSHSSSTTNAPDAPSSMEWSNQNNTSTQTSPPQIFSSRAGVSLIPENAKQSGSINHLPSPTSVETHATNRTSSGTSVKFEPSADACLPKLPLPPYTTPQVADTDSFPHLSPQNEREAASSVRYVPPEPRDSTPDHVLGPATTLAQRSGDELSLQYTSNGVPFYRVNGSSSLNIDRTRDTSQNPSFCSTMSTSYSGTVLGVDLDLQHNFPHSARRSLTPVWFTPIEPKHQTTSREEPSYLQEQKDTKELPSRCVTSPALSALLPIAAAERIVQPNFKTSQLSFFSPSGNLIQTENDSSPPPLPTRRSKSRSSHQRTRINSSSYYETAETPKAYDALAATIGLPPSRPALVPMTTPPYSKAPLPTHLRHHHNYQHPEFSQITSEADSDPDLHMNTPSLIRTPSNVKGCGGVVRPDFHTSWPNTPSTSSQQRDPKSERSLSCLFLSEQNISRFNILSPHKGKTLKKRDPGHRRSQTQSGTSSSAPAVGHLMRSCFCQPYDGAGDGVDGKTRKRDSQTPIARVVEKAGADMGGENRVGDGVRMRGGSEGGKTDRGANGERVRRDSGVSTGVAVRVGVVSG